MILITVIDWSFLKYTTTVTAGGRMEAMASQEEWGGRFRGGFTTYYSFGQLAMARTPSG